MTAARWKVSSQLPKHGVVTGNYRLLCHVVAFNGRLKQRRASCLVCREVAENMCLKTTGIVLFCMIFHLFL